MGTVQKKRRQYRPDLLAGGESYSPEELDKILDYMLTLVYEPGYDVRCSNLAKDLGRGAVDPRTGRHSPQPIQVVLWKLATGYGGYRQYRKVSERPSRTGLPWNWMETKILEWSLGPCGDGQQNRAYPPDAAHVARLLRRHPNEVEEKLRELGDGGIAGFGFQ